MSMMRGLTVRDEQKHIDEGVPGVPFECPVAQALWGMGYRDVNVRATCVEIGEDTLSMSEEGSRFVTDYDARLPVKPTTIALTAGG